MNVIGFVFCILAVLSLGAGLFLEKQVSAHRLRSSYLGHIAANREILDERTSEFYASLKTLSSSEEKNKGEKHTEAQNKTAPPPPPLINPFCSRLDLTLLVEKGSEEKTLYEAAAKLLRTFYKDLFDQKERAETKFLDALLIVVRHQIAHQEFSGLEKVSFNDPHFQMIYYKMLKGTKKGIGYPSLLDYVKMESSASKICLRHAHPHLLSVFFTAKGGVKLYEAIHTPKAPPVTRETIERICQEVHAPLLKREVLDLFEITWSGHDAPKETTLIGEDTDSGISLRKVVSR